MFLKLLSPGYHLVTIRLC